MKLVLISIALINTVEEKERGWREIARSAQAAGEEAEGCRNRQGSEEGSCSDRRAVAESELMAAPGRSGSN
jgi:hypothetical protein